MQAFDIIELISQQKQQDKLYLECLRVPSLSVGVYTLAAGDQDPQQPHSEDEVYYVVSGKARIQVGEEDQAVEAGSIIFVAAQVEHRFHSITEDLSVLVFFAPAEGTQQQK